MSDPKDFPFPAIPVPQADVQSLLRSVQAMRATIMILTGQTDDRQNIAVLKKDSP